SIRSGPRPATCTSRQSWWRTWVGCPDPGKHFMNRSRLVLSLLTLYFFTLTAWTEERRPTRGHTRSLSAPSTDETMTIDGKLDERNRDSRRCYCRRARAKHPMERRLDGRRCPNRLWLVRRNCHSL